MTDDNQLTPEEARAIRLATAFGVPDKATTPSQQENLRTLQSGLGKLKRIEDAR